MAASDIAAGPLADLRVVEAGGEIGVRYCGRLLARLGASVTQVRSAPGPDRPSARAFAAWLDEGKTPATDLDSALAGLGGRPLVIAGQ